MVIAYDQLYAAAWQDVPGGDACVTSLDGSKFFQIFTPNWPNWAQIMDTVIDPNWDRFMNGSISAQQLSGAINGPVNERLR